MIGGPRSSFNGRFSGCFFSSPSPIWLILVDCSKRSWLRVRIFCRDETGRTRIIGIGLPVCSLGIKSGLNVMIPKKIKFWLNILLSTQFEILPRDSSSFSVWVGFSELSEGPSTGVAVSIMFDFICFTKPLISSVCEQVLFWVASLLCRLSFCEGDSEVLKIFIDNFICYFLRNGSNLRYVLAWFFRVYLNRLWRRNYLEIVFKVFR